MLESRSLSFGVLQPFKPRSYPGDCFDCKDWWNFESFSWQSNMKRSIRVLDVVHARLCSVRSQSYIRISDCDCWEIFGNLGSCASTDWGVPSIQVSPNDSVGLTLALETFELFCQWVVKFSVLFQKVHCLGGIRYDQGLYSRNVCIGVPQPFTGKLHVGPANNFFLANFLFSENKKILI